MAVGDLCTLDDVKTMRRDATGGQRDAMLTALIPAVSGEIHRFTNRRFTIDDPAATDRFFPMSPHTGREVRIDDLSALPTQVEVVDAEGMSVYTVVIADDLVALPRNRAADAEPITGFRLRSAVPISEHYELRVRGVWGWPAVPANVVTAAAFAVAEWAKDSMGISTQSPDQWEPGAPPQRSLPLRSLDLVRRYRRPVLA